MKKIILFLSMITCFTGIAQHSLPRKQIIQGTGRLEVSPASRFGGVSEAILNDEAINKLQFDEAIANIDVSTNEILYASNYGVSPDSADNTSRFNTFMAACKAGQYKGELPKGNIRFLSKPNNIDFPFDLGGKGINGTVIIRDYIEAGSVGCFALVSGSSASRIHDMSIESAAGTSGGCIISVISPSDNAISGVILENLWLSTFGTDTHVNTLLFDGRLKITAPYGVRDLCIKNVHAFGGTGFSVAMYSVIGGSWMGGGIYPAGGTGNGLIIGGINNINMKSSFITMDLSTCGDLNLTNCWYMKLAFSSIGLKSGVSINNDNTCSLTHVMGVTSGSVLNNWGDSGITRPGSGWATN